MWKSSIKELDVGIWTLEWRHLDKPPPPTPEGSACASCPEQGGKGGAGVGSEEGAATECLSIVFIFVIRLTNSSDQWNKTSSWLFVELNTFRLFFCSKNVRLTICTLIQWETLTQFLCLWIPSPWAVSRAQI